MTTMMQPAKRTFVMLLLVLMVAAAVNVYLPQGDFLPPGSDLNLPAPKGVIALVTALAVMVVYGLSGFTGIRLGDRMGFPALIDPAVSSRHRFLTPAIWGMVIGLFFIAMDQVFKGLNGFGPLPHPPFPTSVVASLSAGIGEEIIFRLFFIPFWMWLILLLTRNRGRDLVFWTVTLFSALVFSAAHLPSLLMIMGLNSVSAVPPMLLLEVLLLNGVLSIVAAMFYWRYGILAAMGLHFWTDIVWHALYGALS